MAKKWPSFFLLLVKVTMSSSIIVYPSFLPFRLGWDKNADQIEINQNLWYFCTWLGISILRGNKIVRHGQLSPNCRRGCFTTIFFKGWWHLVAFIDHYKHLYEIVRHKLSYMQFYNTQHAYNLLQNNVKLAMYGLNIPYH